MFDGIVTPEESLGVPTEEYSKIVNECVFGKEEPASEDLEEAAMVAYPIKHKENKI